jgi:K+-sensing histidine kinase KdpD
MLCLPMVAHKAYVGVIAMDIDKDHISHIRAQAKLLTMFANQAALALAADHLRQSETNRLKHTLKKIEDSPQQATGNALAFAVQEVLEKG